MAKQVSLKKIAAALILTGVAIGTTAQAASSATGTADAKVISPASITAGTHLNFGTFTNETAGSVTVDTTGARTSSGVVLVTDAANTPAAGTFTVTGESGYTVNVTLPADGTVTLTSGTNSMAVNTFTSSLGASFASKGTDTLAVGATITVTAGQAAGTYSGTYPVTVNY